MRISGQREQQIYKKNYKKLQRLRRNPIEQQIHSAIGLGEVGG